MSDVISAHFRAVSVLWFQSCNLHCNILSHLFYSVVYNVCLYVNKNTDFSAHMCIGSNEAVLFFYLSKSSDVHVLADNCDLSCKSFFYSLLVIQCPCLCKESIDISCCSSKRLCGNVCNIALEFFILCYEVCLCINLNNYCALSILCNNSLAKTFCCYTACFFLSSCKSFFAKELYCFIHIAFCSCKSFLTVHHSGAGHFS